MSFLTFLDMGGYGFYVWSAWGLCCLTLIIIATTTMVKRRHLYQQIQTQIRREGLMSSAPSSNN